MPDDIDIAQQREEEYRSLALMQHGKNHHHRHSLKTSPTHCEDCGEEIPKARRRALPGCCYCRDCQADLERARGGR